MIFHIEVLDAVKDDFSRLSAFLGDSPAGDRFADVLEEAVLSLSEMPHRGRPVGGDVRELIIPFGAGGYIIRYRVRDQTVVIARIFHSLEDRPLA
ncbi:MAG: type II toxin-antitoxin system RelE/ParE family toxin [Caulobacter sp.]|nr:type II toxin-antitoxin system RelE/ParE family toxin [Caulobacter sp.]